MTAPTTNLLIDLRRFHLLEPAQFDELTRNISQFPVEPKAMAQELMRRGLLTPFQVNRLLQGRGRELLLGSYVLLERLGEGGMGAVFKARNWKLGALRALKVIRKDRTAQPLAVQRFQREIRAAAQLSHPNVVHAHDADEVDGVHFIAMEFLAGADLGRRVAEAGPLPPAQACDYIRQAALGLQHAHERGLVHRDIKPSNLLLTSCGVVKILDLGLARLAPSADESESAGTLTKHDSLTGTPDYMAPEQARQSHTVDARADLYSLGATLYFLLTGRPPFPRGPLAAVITALLFDDPEPVEKLRPETPAAVAAVVRRLLAKRPEERYQTAGELADVLKAGSPADAVVVAPAGPAPAVHHADTITGRSTAPGSAPTPEPEPKPRRPRRRPKRWPYFAAVAAVPAVAAAVWLAATLATAPKAGPPAAPGRLLVQCIDPDVRILIHTKGRAEADEHKVNEAIDLSAGDYEVEPASAALPGLRLSRRSISVAPGASETVRVEGFPLGPDALVSRPGWIDGARTWTIEIAEGRTALGPLALSPDGRRLAGAAPDGSIRLMDGRTGEPERTLAAQGGAVLALAWSPDRDNPVLASATGGGVVYLWDPVSGLLPARQAATATALAWAPGGKILAFAAGPEVHVWNIADQTQTVLPRVRVEPVLALAWSPDGAVLAAAGANAVELWRAPDGARRDWTTDERAGHVGPVNGLAWSPDGRTVASAGADGTIRLWNAKDPQKPETVLTGPKGSINAIAWPPGGGKTLASLGDDLNLRLWRADPGGLLRVVPRGAMQGAFSPDGGRIVAGGAMWTARLWETATGRPLGTVVLLSRGAVVLSDDGHYRCYGDAAGSEKEIENLLVYVIQTDQGPTRYPPAEFAAKFNWKNDPKRALLDAR